MSRESQENRKATPRVEVADPEAEALVRAVMGSSSYKLAEEDEAFLKSYETRGIRLELDYLKAELAMQSLGIEHTIVVFGSARIRERVVAAERLRQAKEALENSPDDTQARRRLADAERSMKMSRYYDDARAFGRLVGLSGLGAEDNRVVLMTGGGPGIMEAANRGAHDVGARSIGLNIRLPREQFPNPYIDPGLCFQFHYFAIRKLHFILRARALVAYPGGFGTLDELFEILTLVQTGKTPPIPVVLVGRAFWERVIGFDALIEEGMVSEKDREIFTIVEDAKSAWHHILEWHASKRSDLSRICGRP